MKSRDRRALLLLADAVALFLLLKFAIFPWMSASGEARASVPVKEKTLRKYQQVVALTGTREVDWKTIQARVAEAEKRLLNGTTPAMASAEMQEVVRQMLSQHGIDIRAADFLPVRPVKLGSAQYLAVPLSVNFECKLDQFANFLTAARTGNRVLAIDSLSVTPAQMGVKGGRKAVTVRMTLHGLMQAPASAEKRES